MSAKIFKIAWLPVIILLFISLTRPLYADQNELLEIKNAVTNNKSKWTANETSVSRLTPEERRGRLGTVMPPKGGEKVLTVPSATLPAALDWRNYTGGNYVTPVKEQGACATCWAFAPTAALESSVLISQNTPWAAIDLSEQTALSCSGAGTCAGGFIDYLSNFIRDTGLPDETYYPYTATDGVCSNTYANWLYNTRKVADWHRVEPNLDAIKYALYNKGPLVATLAVYTDFLYYSSGIYSWTWGSPEGYHSALIVGYDDAAQYFIVKSNWGVNWGEAGYFRIAYSELNTVVSFGDWTIAYDYTIPAGFPTIDGIQRVAASADGNPDSANGNGQGNGNGANNGQPAQANNSGGNGSTDGPNQPGSASNPDKQAQPNVAGPGWLMGDAPAVSSAEADAYYASRKVRTGNNLTGASSAPMTGLATDSSPEITELARGLQYDPKLIYDYVHNNIDYVPYYGSLKGATLTYLDGSGNDFDQASLMIALLRASGYTAQYVYGMFGTFNTNIANWLGVDNDSTAILNLLSSGGIPIALYTSYATYTYRVWVKATINGTDYVFDPAFKSYTYTTKIDIGTAMGYNQSDLLANAQSGATVTTDYAQNMNEGNIKSKLAAYSSNLVSAIRSQYPNSDVQEIIGGRSIVQSNLTQYSTYLSGHTMMYSWDDIPSSYIATLRIQHVGIDYTFNMADLSGKRLTLTYSGGIPELRLDGSLIASGTATTSGSKNNLTLTIDHPYAANSGTYVDQTVTYTPESGRSYAIVYDFGRTTDALLMKRQRQLNSYMAQGLADTSESVLGETLNIMGFTWLKEVGLSNRMVSSLADTVSFMHHNVGLMAQEAGYYIDVKAAYFNIQSKHNNSSSVSDSQAHFKTMMLIGSAFEHGMLEQLMGSNNPAVSTMKLFQIANSTGRKVFSATSGNYATIQPQLINYSAADLSNFQSLVNSGYTLILPDNGQLVSGQWKGEGYISKIFNADGSGSMGMIIGGGYYGGYSSSQEWISIPTVFDANEYTLTSIYTSDNIFNLISTVATPTSQEPVDMAGGNYVYGHTDLALGAGAPLGLSFSRSYNSGVNLTNRTLGYGWTHNYDTYLSPTSDGNPGLGMRQPVDAASFIVAAYAILDLMKNQDNIQGWMTASLASKWAIDTLIDNAVAVKMGGKNMEYIKLADGTYSAPPGITTQLIKNGDGTYSLKERFGTQLNFNSSNQISSLADIDGNAMTFAYSGNNLATVTDAFGRTLSLQYDGNNMITRVTDSTGRYATYGYDTNKNLTAYTDPEGKVWAYGYDSNHRMTTLVNPLNITTATNAYDSLGRVQTQTVPRQSGGPATYNFYFSGYRNAEQDPDGKTIVYYYDSKGRITKQQDQLGNAATKTYDGQDHTTKVTNPLSNSATFVYDGNQNLTTTTNALSQTSTNTYDSQYRLITAKDPLNNTTQFAYDSEHHLTGATDAIGNTVSASYYGNGYKYTATDPKGTITTFTYASYGNPSTTKTAAHPQILYSYDTLGRMTNLTDQVSSTTSFVYDKRGLLTSKTDPLGKTSTYNYDSAGRLTSKTDRNNDTVSYAYTTTDKLYTIAYPDSTGVTFTYNQHDRLTQMNDAFGATSYVYDAAGRLTSISNWLSQTVTYTYDANGNILTLTYPGSKTVTYTYDQLNRISTVKNWLNQTATYTYDAAGRATAFTNFNGIATTYTYDNANRLININIPNIASYAFSMDANGNRTGITQTEPLTTSITSSNTAYTYNTQKNRLLTAGTSSFAYDNEGQLNSGYANQYGFDYEHRLTGTSTDTYYYDGAGNRLQATTSGVVTRYIYDAGGNLLAEADGNNNITKYYIYGASGLLAMVTNTGTVYCYHYNAVGSTIAMTDSSKNIVNKYAYDPFGNIVNYVETISQPFTFVGQFGVMTESNGFYYMRARYYDPNTGRFISEDPIGFEGGDVNLMAYVFNNPVNLVDPNGQLAFFWHFGITLAATGDLGLAWDAMMVDWGTQSTNPSDTIQHAMAGEISEGVWQFSAVAIADTNNYIQSSLNSGNFAGAIHAGQDLATPGHAGEEWHGFWSWETPGHILGDIFPSGSTIKQAYQNTTQINSGNWNSSGGKGK